MKYPSINKTIRNCPTAKELYLIIYNINFAGSHNNYIIYIDCVLLQTRKLKTVQLSPDITINSSVFQSSGLQKRIADCCPMLTICPRCCPRHAPDDVPEDAPAMPR